MLRKDFLDLRIALNALKAIMDLVDFVSTWNEIMGLS